MSIPKELYRAYRAVAIDRVRKDYATHLPGEIKINDHAAVIPCEDGAFVDISLWVPKVAAEGYLLTNKAPIQDTSNPDDDIPF
jgi:hypothetical protein